MDLRVQGNREYLDAATYSKELTMLENTDMNARVYHTLRNFYRDNKQWIFQYYDFAIEYNAEMVIRNIPPEELNVMLTDCKVLILTANSVEQNIVTRKLYEEMNQGKGFEYERSQLREAFVDDICVYQFSKVNDINIVHIHPGEMGSFTKEGSARAVRNALLRFQPKLVVSLGVAFGIDPVNQELGSVLLSKGIIPYDVFNKDIDGIFKLDSKQIYSTHSALKAWNVLVRSPDFRLEKNSSRKSLIGNEISFKWENGFMLSGGSVLSNEVKKQALLKAANRISEYDIIGGEMEGTGIYFECADLSIPCIIIKGICDYGAAKNEWDEVIKEADSHPMRYIDYDEDIHLPDKEIRGQRIKDCVQAFATDNAVEALFRLLRFDSQFFEYIKPEMVYREAKEKRFPQITPGFISGLREVFTVLILHLGLLAALFLLNRFLLKSQISEYLALNEDFRYRVVYMELFIIALLILIFSCIMNIWKIILHHPCEIKHPWISFTFFTLVSGTMKFL